MSINLNELFPQLTIKQDHFFSEEEFQSMLYFREMTEFINSKQILSGIKKVKKNFKLLRLKKGTVIHTHGSPSNYGYFLCHGAVTLLIKKNNRQKLQNLPRHILHQVQERVNYLNEQFGIPLNKCETLLSEFYEQKVMFKFLEYKKLYGEGYFGFSDILKSFVRNFTAVATEDTILLQLQKPKFQNSLKDLQLKKEDFIIKTILQNVSQRNSSDSQSISAINKQLYLKMTQIFNYFSLKSFQKDEVIFQQNQLCRSIFFILKGQVELRKTLKMQLPKKILKQQNKPYHPKQIQVKVSRLSQKCYLGENQMFLNTKTRQFTAQSVQNNTILIQIQPTYFLKMIGQFPSLEKQLILSARQKFIIANQNFLKQKNKVIKAFVIQFENIQNKNKQKIINNLIDDGQQHKNVLNHSNNTTFQVFSKEGMFFRDTYQKLQGFQEFELNQSNNKRAAIKKYRIQAHNLKNDEIDENQPFLKYPSTNLARQNDQQFQTFDSKQKLIYSPKKNIHILEFMASAPVSPVKDKRQSITSHQSPSKGRKKTSLGKFHQLTKDQAVFKRVLIKNGIFQHDKSTFKANMIQPIVHPKFDEIIKQCMSRKNQVIRKAIGEKRNQFVKDSYQNTIQSLKNKSLSISKFSNYSLTCKGTQQFKKKLQFFNKNHKRTDQLNGLRNRVAIEQQNLQACIGVNQAPRSSYQKNRSSKQLGSKRLITAISNSQHTAFNKTVYSKLGNMNNRSETAGVNKRHSPQKLILLNHMMKPMTYSSYSSVQF